MLPFCPTHRMPMAPITVAGQPSRFCPSCAIETRAWVGKLFQHCFIPFGSREPHKLEPVN